jgi:hypothetical protein
MDLATAFHRGRQAHAVREPIEFPKWVKIDGNDVLALSAEHELELLTKPSDPEPEVENLLSAPEKREQSPRLVRKG